MFDPRPEHRLLEDPLCEIVVVLDDALREPPVISTARQSKVCVGEGEDLQSNLLLRALNGVRAVADVTADSESEVATDGAWEYAIRLR